MEWYETYWGKKLKEGNITDEDRLLAWNWYRCPVGELVYRFKLENDCSEPTDIILRRWGISITRHLGAKRDWFAKRLYKKAFERANRESFKKRVEELSSKSPPPWVQESEQTS